MFSALTVAASLTGLLMFRLPALTALGAAGVSIAVVCMLASLTFTAGLIGLLRRWIRPSRRAARREAALTAGSAERGGFARLSRAVQRRPWTVALSTMVLLLLAGAPLVTGHLRLPGLESVPRSLEPARVADTLADRFGRPNTPAITVVARTDPATLDQWAARFRADPAVAGVRPARQLSNGTASIAFDTAGEPQGQAVLDMVQRNAGRPATGRAVLGHRRRRRAHGPDGSDRRRPAARPGGDRAGDDRAAVRHDRVARGARQGGAGQPGLARGHVRSADRGVRPRLRQRPCSTPSPSAR
jgi:RND superfamily putative drug exporter